MFLLTYFQSIIVSSYYVIIYIKKTSRCSIMKTVLGREKTAVVERIFRKTFKKEKIDVDKKKKENNVIDIEKNTKAFKLAHY